jgi:hypothetical protein
MWLFKLLIKSEKRYIKTMHTGKIPPIAESASLDIRA